MTSYKQCTCCSEVLSPLDFPPSVTEGCEHARDYCLSCIRKWISTMLDDGVCSDMECPGCQQKLEADRIAEFTTPAVYER